MDNYIPDDTIKLTLSNDYAFKRIFSNEENKDILSSLLSVILKIPVKDIQDLQIENTLIGNTYIYEKTGILDIKLTLSSGEKINVEMQKSWQADYINRVLFYWANRYKENFQKRSKILKPNKNNSNNHTKRKISMRRQSTLNIQTDRIRDKKRINRHTRNTLFRSDQSRRKQLRWIKWMVTIYKDR